MYPALALALVQRGYAVLRYDMRGIGKSGGSSASETWDQALADAAAAFGFLADDANVDPKRIYLLGYGNGADLALATRGTGDARVAGIVALAPTVLGYRNCAAAVGSVTPESRVDSPPRPRNRIDSAVAKSGAWAKSLVGHDPAVLAARATAPLLVLHPGIPVCGETKDQIDAYDDALRAANPLATIVAANDLTARFGGRYEAEAPVDTEEFFPYRFDASTAGAIADWLDNPKTAPPADATRGAAGSAPVKPPPPPPGVDTSGSGLPNPHRSSPPVNAQDVQPGIVLPAGATPPPQVAPAPSGSATPPATTSSTPVPTPSAPTPEATPPATPPAVPAAATPAVTPMAAPPTAAPPTAAPALTPPAPANATPGASAATPTPATATPIPPNPTSTPAAAAPTPATATPATATPTPATATTPAYAATSTPTAAPANSPPP
jgi:dienelactone hydrolase